VHDERSPYTIAPARPEHAAALPAIEIEAAALFPQEDLPAELRRDTTPVSEFEQAARAGRLWVALDASGAPVGFAVVTRVDGAAHLLEMDVLPAHGRRGLGTGLVRAVVTWARRRGLPSVTLTTFRHLAWNGPFYRRLGFEELNEAQLTPGLREHLAQEVADGLEGAKRVVMRLDLTAG
jgi:GNAT superfamily N-acetyltransferase